jgi:acetate kinase
MTPADQAPTTRILTINCGSSSLKAAVFELEPDAHRILSATAERVGLSGSSLRVRDASGAALHEAEVALPDFAAAIRETLAALRRTGLADPPTAIGHRVVHGGQHYSAPARIDDALLDTLRQVTPLAPDHLPQAIVAIRATAEAFPSVPQIACFDTAFHRHMPRVAQLYALPRDLIESGIERYGFHGLSYEYILSELRREAPEAARGRLIIAHLGNGASMAAVRDGASQDTTMGFTPTGGLVMSTRTGDLDPGVLLYLLEERGQSPADLRELVNAHAGLLGLSQTSPDMRDLLAREQADVRAADAIELFCYTARKTVGALAAVLGGLDTLIFTGGIGEHAASVRWRICADLGFLGVRLDDTRNDASAAVISPNGSPITVRVMPTDEDLMIARHTRNVLDLRPSAHPRT